MKESKYYKTDAMNKVENPLRVRFQIKKYDKSNSLVRELANGDFSI